MSNSQFEVDLPTLWEGATPAGTIIADGAFDGMVGKTVPVTMGEDKVKVGEAEIFKDSDGNVRASIRFVL